MTTLLGEFKAITGALNDAGIEYAVCGGWAMAIHGLPRSTMDIDLLKLADDLSRIIQLVETLEYDVADRPLHFDIEIRRVSKISRELNQLITLDLLLVNDSIKDVWESRLLQIWDQGTTSVVSKDGLIKMKILAGRKQDLADIERLREAENEG
jgi:hypothetical protein